ncbi:MAG: hypothetical protein K2J82_01595 [Muribaculaceae bacterium]|nr:hypothetical protein [Muribaculaceae bacterium]MDE6753287.1 hypothetical protein [Muribaculaceae bacterium]
MNNLSLHIEYLLLRHDCVIVPGLGAFIATQTKARIDHENGVILPPMRTVMFNHSVTVDDGLLANSFARKSGLSFEDARQIIFREVNILKSEISTNGKYSLGKLGTFFLGDENTLFFSPAQDRKVLSSLGYLPVNFVNISSDSKSSLETSPSQQLSEKPNIKRRKFRFKKVLSRVAVICGIVAAASIASLYSPVPSDSREQRASVVPVEALIPKKSSAVNTSDTISRKGLESISNTKQSEPRHYLIVATFKTLEEAENFTDKYSSEDFPLMTVSSKRVTRVAVAASDDKETLQARLNSPEITKHFSQAWIWSR